MTQEQNPFDIFGTKIEDVKSYEEAPKRDWSKTFLELDPSKGDVTILVKLVTNIWDPKNPIPLKYIYKLPYPDNPTSNYHYDSPATIGLPCIVMNKFFDLNRQGKTDPIAAQKAKLLSRKSTRCVVVQIVNDLQDKSNNGQFRLLKFPDGMALDKLIQSKINPSDKEREMGVEPENIFDVYESQLLIITCSKGDYGRDFSRSSWAPAQKNHGVLVPENVDANGKIISYRPLRKEDANNSEETKKHLNWLIGELSKEDVSLKEQWLYKEHSEDDMERVKKSLDLIVNGEISATESTTNNNPTSVQAPSQPATPTQQGGTQQPVANPVQNDAIDNALNELGLK